MARPSKTQRKIARLQRKVRFLDKNINFLSQLCAGLLNAKQEVKQVKTKENQNG